MNYQQAVGLVRSEYETICDSPHSEFILTNLTYDGYNYFSICLYDKGDRVILTDTAKTQEVFDEVTEDEWKALCDAHGFVWQGWSIERDYNSNADVEAFIGFLCAIANLYEPIED